MAMREPTLNDDELQSRLVNLRDTTTTKHIQLLGQDANEQHTYLLNAVFLFSTIQDSIIDTYLH